MERAAGCSVLVSTFSRIKIILGFHLYYGTSWNSVWFFLKSLPVFINSNYPFEAENYETHNINDGDQGVDKESNEEPWQENLQKCSVCDSKLPPPEISHFLRKKSIFGFQKSRLSTNVKMSDLRRSKREPLLQEMTDFWRRKFWNGFRKHCKPAHNDRYILNESFAGKKKNGGCPMPSADTIIIQAAY